MPLMADSYNYGADLIKYIIIIANASGRTLKLVYIKSLRIQISTTLLQMKKYLSVFISIMMLLVPALPHCLMMLNDFQFNITLLDFEGLLRLHDSFRILRLTLFACLARSFKGLQHCSFFFNPLLEYSNPSLS